MSGDLEVTRKGTITVNMSEEHAGKLERSIGRLLAATQHMDPKRYEQLVNTGTVDDLLSLRTAILNVLPDKAGSQ